MIELPLEVKDIILTYLSIYDILNKNIYLSKINYKNLREKDKIYYLSQLLLKKDIYEFNEYFDEKEVISLLNKPNRFLMLYDTVIYYNHNELTEYFISELFYKILIKNWKGDDLFMYHRYYYKIMLDSASKYDRYLVVSTLYRRYKRVFSSNIEKAPYNSITYKFLIKKCNFVQYRNK